MRTFLVLAMLASTAAAAPSRVVRPVEDFRLVFLDGDVRSPVRQGASDDAMIDMGRVRGKVVRRFRLRIEGSSSASRFVRVHAFLQSDMPGHRIRLDGRLLTGSPQLIDASSPLRVAVAHTLEIEVPASEPEGVIADTIVWLVEDAR